MDRKLKQLKSTVKDLRTIFEKNISVEVITEKLECCRLGETAADVREKMATSDYDVLGVQDGSTVVGFVDIADLAGTEKVTTWANFRPPNLIADSTPLIDLFSILAEEARVFVLERNHVNGIVTRGDLQKAPVRMLLFGMVTLLEMNFLRIIRSRYADESWQRHLSSARLEKAIQSFESLKSAKEQIEVTDCLELCDKSKLILADSGICAALGFSSKTKGNEILKSIEEFRNDLAHGQDLGQRDNRWRAVIEIAHRVEDLLSRAERI